VVGSAGEGLEGYEFVSEEPVVAMSFAEGVTGISSGNGTGNGKREHKRLKHWGKKNKKLRDKTPYGDLAQMRTNAFTVRMTNRSTAGLDLTGPLPVRKTNQTNTQTL